MYGTIFTDPIEENTRLRMIVPGIDPQTEIDNATVATEPLIQTRSTSGRKISGTSSYTIVTPNVDYRRAMLIKDFADGFLIGAFGTLGAFTGLKSSKGPLVGATAGAKAGAKKGQSIGALLWGLIHG